MLPKLTRPVSTHACDVCVCLRIVNSLSLVVDVGFLLMKYVLVCPWAIPRAYFQHRVFTRHIALPCLEANIKKIQRRLRCSYTVDRFLERTGKQQWRLPVTCMGALISALTTFLGRHRCSSRR